MKSNSFFWLVSSLDVQFLTQVLFVWENITAHFIITFLCYKIVAAAQARPVVSLPMCHKKEVFVISDIRILIVNAKLMALQLEKQTRTITRLNHNSSLGS